MRKWKICGALAITLLVLPAPSSDSQGNRPCPEGAWAIPIELIVGLDREADEAILQIFESDLDWIAQNLRIPELFVSRWLSVRLGIALVQIGPETRARKPVPFHVAARKLGELKAALEDLLYVAIVEFNFIGCSR